MVDSVDICPHGLRGKLGEFMAPVCLRSQVDRPGFPAAAAGLSQDDGNNSAKIRGFSKHILQTRETDRGFWDLGYRTRTRCGVE